MLFALKLTNQLSLLPIKKHFIVSLFLLLVFIGNESDAQNSFGASIGNNFSKLNYSGTPDQYISEFTTNIFFGISSNIKIGGKFFAPIDINFQQKGERYLRGKSLNYVRTRANYFELSPMIEFRPIPKLGISVGGYAGLTRNVNVNYGGDNGWQPRGIDCLCSDLHKLYFEPWDIGLKGAIQYYMKNIFIKAAYNQGLTPALDFTVFDNQSAIVGNGKAYHQFIQVGLGYLFEVAAH